ncbi:MAG: hypothetical protein BGO98_21520 [Myxococcales bacterium 68-20]|nr:hypothetical protein [Myxococcales bacterium]OJY28134.1 MAG: hypothetical protein BGO98_21520 [Myxococcales bacterium 68-20]
MRTSITIALATLALFIGCAAQEEVYLGVAPPADPPSFTGDDAATLSPEAGLMSYCPSSTCPPGFTTCPNSRFPCDINLRTDLSNCGACGAACPTRDLGADFACVEGSCVMTCTTDGIPKLDCDGIIDNGCEVTLGTNDNCTGCGEKCEDPEKPCTRRRDGKPGCGCGGSDVYCPLSGACVDLRDNDQNCGACGNQCDPRNGGESTPPNAYYGCINGECGRLKCFPTWADCDGDPSNGCETDLFDPNNCAGCGTVCDSTEGCQADEFYQPRCVMCPEGETYCPTSCGIVVKPGRSVCTGECRNLATDPQSCGACGFSCGLKPDGVRPVDYASPVCSFGSCDFACDQGRADCNGNQSDGCEVDTNSDPRNCGGCRIECNAVAGQACVGGRCVVEPCETDGGITR